MEYKKRISWDEYAIQLAKTAALKSEDVYRQVGCVAFSVSKRVVGVAYNGTPPGFVMEESLKLDREKRRPFMIHAEMNLCALFKIGDVHTVAITCCPCHDCFKNLITHGVKRVVFQGDYPDDNTKKLALAYKDIINLTRFEI